MAKKQADTPEEVETTGHEWDGIQELNKPLPKWWLYMLYARSSGRSVIGSSIQRGRSCRATPKAGSATASASRWPRIVAAAQAEKAGFRDKIAASRYAIDQGRSRAIQLRPCWRRGRVRRQLRALPWPWRARCGRLSESARRCLAVGRLARRHPPDHSARHPRRRSRDA